MNQFATLLKNRRLQAGLTQRTLAERLSVSSKTLSRWERGLDEPRVSHRQALAKFIRIPLIDLHKLIDTNEQRSLDMADRIRDLESRVDDLVSLVEVLFDHISIDETSLTLHCQNQSLHLDESAQHIQLSNQHNSLILAPNGTAIFTNNEIELSSTTCSIHAEISEINSSVTEVSGVFSCQTLISDNVIATTYSPGLGNLL